MKALFQIDNVRAFQGNALLRQGSAILISILLAQSVLPKEDIGRYEQLLFIGFVITSFWVTGLMQALLSRYHKVQEALRAVFLTNVALIFGGLGAILTLGFWFGRHWLVPLLTGQEQLPYLLPFLLFLLFNLATFLLENFYLLWNRPLELLAFSAVTYLIQMIAVIYPAWMGMGLEPAIWALTGVGALRFLWLLLRMWRGGLRRSSLRRANGVNAGGIRDWRLIRRSALRLQVPVWIALKVLGNPDQSPTTWRFRCPSSGRAKLRLRGQRRSFEGCGVGSACRD